MEDEAGGVWGLGPRTVGVWSPGEGPRRLSRELGRDLGWGVTLSEPQVGRQVGGGCSEDGHSTECKVPGAGPARSHCP